MNIQTSEKTTELREAGVMKLGEISVDQRFRGPPNSGNGGYVCGRLAAFIDGGAEITLRKPPPLEVAMNVETGKDGKVLLLASEELIAEGRPAEVKLDAPEPPTFEDAINASMRTIDPADHGAHSCFVCSPVRAEDDGLRILAGPADANDTNWQDHLAAPWIPGEDLTGSDGDIAPEFVWAALDCPTGYTSFRDGSRESRLLGRMAVEIERRPKPGERCTILSWRISEEGRKLFSAGVLYGQDREPLACATATWFAVEQEIFAA